MSIACCHKGCGASVCFTPEVEKRLRRTHEFWMCPFGHSQHFTKETPEEVELRLAQRRGDNYRRWFEEASAEFGRCPLCGWKSQSGIGQRWQWMLRHFAKAHADIGGAVLYHAYRDVLIAERESA